MPALDEFESIAREIRSIEEKRSSFGEKAREIAEGNGFLESGPLFKKVKERGFSGRIGAVDGGVLASEFHAFDLVLVRAAGVVFDYENGKLRGYEFFPERFPDYGRKIKQCLESYELNWFKDIERLKAEVICCRKMIEEKKPRMLLMDGSVVPQRADQPAQDSQLYADYNGLIYEYNLLFEEAKRSETILAGVIKDCRSKSWISLAEKSGLKEAEEVLGRSNDTTILYYAMKRGERTSCFKYASEAREHPILKDFGEKAREISCFYLKAVEFDRPTRVEFVGGSEVVEEVAEAALDLSRHNKSYAYPAVLIEADLRATMNPRSLKFFSGKCSQKSASGPEGFP